MEHKTFHYATCSGRFTCLIQVESKNFTKIEKKIRKISFHLYIVTYSRFSCLVQCRFVSMINDAIYHVEYMLHRCNFKKRNEMKI